MGNRMFAMEYAGGMYLCYVDPQNQQEIKECFEAVTGVWPKNVVIQTRQNKAMGFYEQGAVVAGLFPCNGEMFMIPLDEE